MAVGANDRLEINEQSHRFRGLLQPRANSEDSDVYFQDQLLGVEPYIKQLNEPFASSCQTWYIFGGGRIQICTMCSTIDVKDITVGHGPCKRRYDAEGVPRINISIGEESVRGGNVSSTKCFFAASKKSKSLVVVV